MTDKLTWQMAADYLEEKGFDEQAAALRTDMARDAARYHWLLEHIHKTTTDPYGDELWAIEDLNENAPDLETAISWFINPEIPRALPLESLQISGHVASLLLNAGYKTIGDVQDASPENLAEIEGVGLLTAHRVQHTAQHLEIGDVSGWGGRC